MIPGIKKILMATDLSENARYAFGYAASLANRYDAGITVLHVIEDTPRSSHGLVIDIVGKEKWKALRQEGEKSILEKLKTRLEEFCEEISADSPACPFIADAMVVKIGNPVEEILKQVDSSECDLVVMGARGLGILAQAVMGSISRRVLRLCKKPVLVVRLPEE